MNKTVTIILVVVFAALVGAALWFDRPQDSSTAPTGSVTPTLGPLWSFTDADVTEIRLEDLTNTELPALDMRKNQDGKWILYGMLVNDSRLSREANQETVTSFINQLGLLTPTADLGEGLDLPTFGLDGTGFLLTVKTSDGTSYLIEVSRNTTPSQKGYYVLPRSGKRVYVAPINTMDRMFGMFLSQPVLATVTPAPATATPEATPNGTPGTDVLTSATATPAP